MNNKGTKGVLTVKKASEFLAMNNYPGQRDVGPKHVDMLFEKMQSGDFHWAQIATIVYEGEKHLANGQHQCHAVIRHGESVKMFLIEFTEEEGDTKDDIANVFAQFNNDKGRSRGDVAWIYANQYKMGRESGWSPRLVKLCNTALAWIASKKFSYKISKEDNSKMLAEHKRQCEFVREILKIKPSDHLRKGPVVAAMIMSHLIDKTMAREFWARVANGIGVTKEKDPCGILRDFLLSKSIYSHSGKENVSPKAFHCNSIYAWNGFVTGRVVRKFKSGQEVPQMESPK